MVLRAATMRKNSGESANKTLTSKQKEFIKIWASGESIQSAAIRAGYHDGGRTGYATSKYPVALELYAKEKALYEASCMMTRKKVMDGLLEGVEMAKIIGEPASVIAGWREVGRMCGYYEPVKRQLDINITGDVNIKRLESMPDSELLKLIKGEVTDVVFNEIEETEDEA